MLDNRKKAELWRSVRELSRAERRDLMEALRRSLEVGDDEAARWDRLMGLLAPGLAAGDESFEPFDPESIIAEARRQQGERGGAGG